MPLPEGKLPDGPDASESVLDDEDTETEEVAAGEAEGADKDADDAEREIWRKIEQRKYTHRFTNYDEEENENRLDQMRKSVE